MNWRIWKPRHTVSSVARTLAQGLRDGSVPFVGTREESFDSKLLDAEFELIQLSPRDESQSVLERLDRLERALDEISTSDVDPIRLWLLKAKLWGRRSDCLEDSARVRALESAIGLLDKVIDSDPENASAWYNRACNQMSLGHKREAMHDLRLAIQLSESTSRGANARSLVG